MKLYCGTAGNWFVIAPQRITKLWIDRPHIRLFSRDIPKAFTDEPIISLELTFIAHFKSPNDAKFNKEQVKKFIEWLFVNWDFSR